MPRCGLLIAALLLVASARGSARQPSPADADVVSITVTVIGEVVVSTAHRRIRHGRNPFALDPEPDVRLRLVDRVNATTTVSTRVDFGNRSGELLTGDVVEVPLTLTLPRRLLDGSGLGDDGATSGRRRLLASRRRLASRLVARYHGSRRRLQAVVSLQGLLAALAAEAEAEAGAGEQPALAGWGVPTGSDWVRRSFNGAKDLVIVGGKAQNLTSITFLMSAPACGRTFRSLSTASVTNRWYDTAAAAGVAGGAAVNVTLESYHRVCTYDRLRFPPDLNRVYGPVAVGCSGTHPTLGRYDLSASCGDPELSGLWEAAKAHLKAVDPLTFSRLSQFRRVVIVFPIARVDKKCDWSGVADVGCPGDGDCVTWYAPDTADTELQLSSVFHELGHNIGLAHSARVVCDAARCELNGYGDPTDPMGSAGPQNPSKNFVCMSAPQAYRAGWASPLPDGDFPAASLRAGAPRSLALPAAALSAAHMLRIAFGPRVLTTAGKYQQRALFLSYRVRQAARGYDSGLADTLSGRVSIHEYNETADTKPADQANPPIILALLDVPRTDGQPRTLAGWPTIADTYTYAPAPGAPGLAAGVGGLRVRLVGKSGSEARVELCRFEVGSEAAGGEEGCYDGLDNDCDGLTDDKDPDCGLVAAAPQQPPPPPLNKGFRSQPPPPPPPPQRSPPPPPLHKVPPSPKLSPPPRKRQGMGRRSA